MSISTLKWEPEKIKIPPVFNRQVSLSLGESSHFSSGLIHYIFISSSNTWVVESSHVQSNISHLVRSWPVIFLQTCLTVSPGSATLIFFVEQNSCLMNWWHFNFPIDQHGLLYSSLSYLFFSVCWCECWQLGFLLLLLELNLFQTDNIHLNSLKAPIPPFSRYVGDGSVHGFRCCCRFFFPNTVVYLHGFSFISPFYSTNVAATSQFFSTDTVLDRGFSFSFWWYWWGCSSLVESIFIQHDDDNVHGLYFFSIFLY